MSIRSVSELTGLSVDESRRTEHSLPVYSEIRGDKEEASSDSEDENVDSVHSKMSSLGELMGDRDAINDGNGQNERGRPKNEDHATDGSGTGKDAMESLDSGDLPVSVDMAEVAVDVQEHEVAI